LPGIDPRRVHFLFILLKKTVDVIMEIREYRQLKSMVLVERGE